MLHPMEPLSDTSSIYHAILEHSHPSQWDDPGSKLHSATIKHSRTCLLNREDYTFMLFRTERRYAKYWATRSTIYSSWKQNSQHVSRHQRYRLQHISNITWTVKISCDHLMHFKHAHSCKTLVLISKVLKNSWLKNAQRMKALGTWMQVYMWFLLLSLRDTGLCREKFISTVLNTFSCNKLHFQAYLSF